MSFEALHCDFFFTEISRKKFDLNIVTREQLLRRYSKMFCLNNNEY